MSSGLEVNTTFFPLQWILYFVKPTVEINGQVHVVPWGRQFAPLAPGQYHVRIYYSYMFGPASMAETPVQIYENHVTGLEYSAALWTFMPGTIRQLGTKPFGT